MKKSITIITTALVISMIAASAFAWGHGRGQGRGNCQGYNSPVMESLTQDQKDQLSTLRQEFIDQTYELRSGKMAKMQEMKMLLETSSPDRAKLAKLSDDILALQKELRDKRIDHILKVKEIAPELASMGMGRGGFGKGSGCGKGGFGPRHGGRGLDEF